jgi:2-polyprenyl-6-methoxyphenol hydroxylase-like FAD-dependent oxidoreductase
MTGTAPIVVAGGGIGGLTAALALAQRGLPVEVYERRSEAEIRSAPGSGLTIWSNAATSLGWLGLGAELLARAEVVEAIRNTDTSGRLLFRMATGRHLHPGALPSVSVGRGDLADLLMGACAARGVPVRYGREVTGYADRDGGVEVLLAGGGAATGRALVGADGIRSAVHGQLRGAPPIVHLGRTVYRGICGPDRDLLAACGLEPHVPALFNDPDTDIGGGLYPVGGDRLSWTLSCPAAPGGHDAPGDQRRHALALVGPLPAAVGRAVRATPPEGVIRTDIAYHRWHEGWGEGAVTLLGDAAHAMPNDLGQGACQAIEDGLVLADALAAAGDDVRAGLRGYERRRVERVKWVHEQSVRVATARPVRNPLLRTAARLATRAFLAAAEKSMWTRMQQPPELLAPVPPAGAGREAVR